MRGEQRPDWKVFRCLGFGLLLGHEHRRILSCDQGGEQDMLECSQCEGLSVRGGMGDWGWETFPEK